MSFVKENHIDVNDMKVVKVKLQPHMHQTHIIELELSGFDIIAEVNIDLCNPNSLRVNQKIIKVTSFDQGIIEHPVEYFNECYPKIAELFLDELTKNPIVTDVNTESKMAIVHYQNCRLLVNVSTPIKSPLYGMKGNEVIAMSIPDEDVVAIEIAIAKFNKYRNRLKNVMIEVVKTDFSDTDILKYVVYLRRTDVLFNDNNLSFKGDVNRIEYAVISGYKIHKDKVLEKLYYHIHKLGEFIGLEDEWYNVYLQGKPDFVIGVDHDYGIIKFYDMSYEERKQLGEIHNLHVLEKIL